MHEIFLQRNFGLMPGRAQKHRGSKPHHIFIFLKGILIFTHPFHVYQSSTIASLLRIPEVIILRNPVMVNQTGYY